MRQVRTIALVLFAVGGLSSVALGTTAAGAPSPAADTISPISLKWTAAGEAALAKGQSPAAIDAFESALAVDPKNSRAFVGMAEAYEAQKLPGRAIKYYREALALEPNDLNALEGQGEALIARGATTRAQVNLDRIKFLCKTDCSSAKRLETALAAPAPAIAPTASAEPAKPTVAKN